MVYFVMTILSLFYVNSTVFSYFHKTSVLDVYIMNMLKQKSLFHFNSIAMIKVFDSTYRTNLQVFIAVLVVISDEPLLTIWTVLQQFYQGKLRKLLNIWYASVPMKQNNFSITINPHLVSIA